MLALAVLGFLPSPLGNALAAPPPRHPVLLEQFLEIDAEFRDADVLARARSAAKVLSVSIGPCAELDIRSEHFFSCLLAALLQDSAIVPVESPTLVESTVTSALDEQRGSCAALVAMVLAVTEAVGAPFDAAVLRDHVLLARRGSPEEFFETLDGGRRLDTSDLVRQKASPTGRPVLVRPVEYVAYYLDNLAARLQGENGSVDKVESMFLRAVEIAPSAARIRYNHGTFLLQQGRFAEAEEMLSRAIDLGWKDAAAYVNRGAARWQLGRVKAARRDFEKALRLDPANREAATNLRRPGEEPH